MYNHQRMQGTGKPVRIIKARHTGSKKGTPNAAFEEGGNLYASLPASISCRLMLTENI